MDKVYQRAGEDLRAIHVTRTLAHEALTATETREIWEISSDRVLVESYSWRITSFFKVFSHMYRWYKPLYSHSFRNCLSLTSYHIKNHPRHNFDGQHFTGVQNLVRAISVQQDLKRRNVHEEATAQKRVRTRNTEACFCVMTANISGSQ